MLTGGCGVVVQARHKTAGWSQEEVLLSISRYCSGWSGMFQRCMQWLQTQRAR
jgi:hypothetical protein